MFSKAAFSGNAWADRDRAYFRHPLTLEETENVKKLRSECWDKSYETSPTLIQEIRRTSKRTILKPGKTLLNKFCGFSCWMEWRFFDKLFCKHNHSVCLTCGQTWIRLDLPPSHLIKDGNVHCNNKEAYSLLDVFKHYQ